MQSKPEPKNENTHIVKPDWFWYSIQNGFADENEYLYKDVSLLVQHLPPPPKSSLKRLRICYPTPSKYLESIAESATPSADRRESLPVSFSSHHHNNKRKRKLLSQKVHETTPSGSGKRRSSVSDAGLLSASGSLLDYTASPSVLKFDGKKSLDTSATEPKKKSMRYNHFMDLFGTESNYVGILHTIVSVGGVFVARDHTQLGDCFKSFVPCVRSLAALPETAGRDGRQTGCAAQQIGGAGHLQQFLTHSRCAPGDAEPFQVSVQRHRRHSKRIS